MKKKKKRKKLKKKKRGKEKRQNKKERKKYISKDAKYLLIFWPFVGSFIIWSIVDHLFI
jgi:cell division septal protein FtsQ